MTRRGTGRGWTALALVLCLALPVGALLQPWFLPGRGALPPVPRGVLAPLLLITVPGLSNSHVGHLSGQDGATPALDRLAREGVSFTRFWAASNDPVASAAALLSGRAPILSGVTDVGSQPPPGAMTLAGHLRTRGRATVAVLADPRVAHATLARHFELQVDTQGAADTDALLTLAVDALRAQPDAFVWVDLPAVGLLAEGPASPAGAAALDAALARLLDALQAGQRLESLVLCVTGTSGVVAGVGVGVGGGAGDGAGDGVGGGAGGGAGDGAGSVAGGDVGAAASPAVGLGEPALAVPCLLRLPGQGVRGRQVSVAASSLDLAPTLGELVLKVPGSSAWPGQCGQSLMNSLTGGQGARRVRVAAGLHPAPGGRPPARALAVRADDTKLIVTADGLRPLALYDLAADPDERHDLAPERPFVVEAMQRHLANWAAGCGAP